MGRTGCSSLLSSLPLSEGVHSSLHGLGNFYSITRWALWWILRRPGPWVSYSDPGWEHFTSGSCHSSALPDGGGADKSGLYTCRKVGHVLTEQRTSEFQKERTGSSSDLVLHVMSILFYMCPRANRQTTIKRGERKEFFTFTFFHC